PPATPTVAPTSAPTTAPTRAPQAASTAAPTAAPTAAAAGSPAAAAGTPTATKAAAASGAPVKGGTFTYGNSKPAKNIINPLNTIGTGQNVLIEALFLRLVYGRQWGDGLIPQDSGPIDLAVAEKMTEVEGARKMGDNVVRIELEQPIPIHWVNGAVGYWPMPKHIFGAMPLDKIFDEPYATKPIGNGPFKATRFVDGQYMEMDANEDFYLGRPNVDKFIVRFGDADTLTAAMEAQEIEGMSAAAGPVFDRLTGLPHVVGNP